MFRGDYPPPCGSTTFAHSVSECGRANDHLSPASSSAIIIPVKTLSQSLVDFELPFLRVLAAQRGVELTKARRYDVVEQLETALASPVSLAIALDTLSEEARAALQALLRHNGFLETPRFSREYGDVRAFGAGRLEREEPWLSPANPAEELWYLGLVFKGFRQTAGGNVEVVYIPVDVAPHLAERLTVEPGAKLTFEAPVVGIPPVVQPPDLRAREDVFSLLVYAQTSPLRLGPDDQLTTQELQALNPHLLHPETSPALERSHWPHFVVQLTRRMGLVAAKSGRLALQTEAVRAWLQAGQRSQLRRLQDAWRADPTWNDLWHVPGLVPKPTGWENSPMLGRAKILGYLAQTPAGEWLSLSGFVEAVKRFDPDFQRPSGDYDSWYLTDEQGNSLQGFEHWDRVEGAFIRHLIGLTLPNLGVVELGHAAGATRPDAFRLTASGSAWLVTSSAEAPETSEESFSPLFGSEDFSVRVPNGASLYDRFQLARFADLKRREPQRVIYEITQQSVGRALKSGISADQMTAFLARATKGRSPLKVVETLRDWGRRPGAARLQRLTLLRLRDETMIAELRRHPEVGPLLGETVGPLAVLVQEDNVRRLRQLLEALGYLAPGR
jgi:hypothetical protein